MQQKRSQHTRRKTTGPRVSNKVELDAKDPIPFDRSGRTLCFVRDRPYIPFLNPNDTFAKDLVELRTLSATHNACISTKARYCAGVGVTDTGGKEIEPQIAEWFSAMNLRGQGITKLIRQIFGEFFTFGNCPIELVKFTVGGKKRLFVYPHSILEWRLGAPNENDIAEEAIQSKLFLNEYQGFIDLKTDIQKAKRLPIYNPLKKDKENWKADDKGAMRTIIWYKNEFTGYNYYGMADWIAAMIFALLEYKGARYNLDNFDNNMVVATILALKGTVSQKEVDAIAKKIIRQHTGDGKRGRTVVVSSEEGNLNGSDLHKLDTKTDGSFVDADDKWSQKIILAHEWDAVLAGILSSSSLGKGSGYITKILEHKLNTVIRPAQNDLMTEVLSHIFKIAKDWMGLPFDKHQLAIKNAVDISGLTDVDITPAVKRNEVREAKGLPKDESPKGEEYLGKSNAKGGDDV